MRTLLQLVFGVRDDLELHRRWWHRLFNVGLIPVVMAAGGGAWVVAGSIPPRPTARNTQILADLVEFTQANSHLPPKAAALPAESPERRLAVASDAVPDFARLPGQLGVREDDGSIGPLSTDGLLTGRCGNPLQATAVLESGISITVRSPRPAEIEAATGRPISDPESQFVPVRIPNEADGDVDEGFCEFPSDLGVKTADSVVKWRYRSTALRTRQTVITGIVVLAFLWLALNVYYRGFIYVVYGSRRSPERA